VTGGRLGRPGSDTTASVGHDDEVTTGPDDADDAARLAQYAADLVHGIEEALPGWVEAQVARIMVAWSGEVPTAVRDEAGRAGRAARDELGPQIRALLALDIDDQRTNPMAFVRSAAAYPTAVLRSAGVPPVERDATAEAQFPDDDYDLVPTRFADLDPSLHEAGLLWGAAKAHVHLRRRRGEGRR
jgi:hypothetical protein